MDLAYCVLLFTNTDCNVPCRWSEDCALGSFVNFQRRKYRENKLPRDRKEQLLSIGFEFDVLPSGAQKRKAERPTVKSVKEARVTPFNEKRWNGMYAALMEYKKDHGKELRIEGGWGGGCCIYLQFLLLS